MTLSIPPSPSGPNQHTHQTVKVCGLLNFEIPKRIFELFDASEKKPENHIPLENFIKLSTADYKTSNETTFTHLESTLFIEFFGERNCKPMFSALHTLESLYQLSVDLDEFQYKLLTGIALTSCGTIHHRIIAKSKQRSEDLLECLTLELTYFLVAKNLELPTNAKDIIDSCIDSLVRETLEHRQDYEVPSVIEELTFRTSRKIKAGCADESIINPCLKELAGLKAKFNKITEDASASLFPGIYEGEEELEPLQAGFGDISDKKIKSLKAGLKSTIAESKDLPLARLIKNLPDTALMIHFFCVELDFTEHEEPVLPQSINDLGSILKLLTKEKEIKNWTYLIHPTDLNSILTELEKASSETTPNKLLQFINEYFESAAIEDLPLANLCSDDVLEKHETLKSFSNWLVALKTLSQQNKTKICIKKLNEKNIEEHSRSPQDLVIANGSFEQFKKDSLPNNLNYISVVPLDLEDEDDIYNHEDATCHAILENLGYGENSVIISGYRIREALKSEKLISEKESIFHPIKDGSAPVDPCLIAFIRVQVDDDEGGGDFSFNPVPAPSGNLVLT